MSIEQHPPSKQRAGVGRLIRRLESEARVKAKITELKRINTDVLTVEGVANLLYCSVQAVRNIPVDALPRYNGPGRRLLYLKEDVIRFLRRNNNRCPDDDMNSGDNNSLINSLVDNVRGRSD